MVSLRSWARVPDAAYAAAVAAMKVPGKDDAERELSPMEAGQVGEILRLAKLALTKAKGPGGQLVAGSGQGPAQAGAPPQRSPPPAAGAGGEVLTSLFAPPPEAAPQVAAPQTPGASAAEPSGGAGRILLVATGQEHEGGRQPGAGPAVGDLGGGKVKLSNVMDQGDDTEIRPLTVPQLRSLIDHWKTTYNDGEDPQELRKRPGTSFLPWPTGSAPGGPPSWTSGSGAPTDPTWGGR